MTVKKFTYTPPPPPRIHNNPDQPQIVMDCSLARDTPPVNVSIFHSFQAVIADAISSLKCMKNNIIYEKWTYSRIMYFDWEKWELLPLILQNKSVGRIIYKRYRSF